MFESSEQSLEYICIYKSPCGEDINTLHFTHNLRHNCPLINFNNKMISNQNNTN